LFRKLRLLSFLLLAVVYGGYAQIPVVTIVATPLAGCAPLAVSFNGTATNGGSGWSWTFPGGTPGTSSSQNAAALFSTPGTYTVKLTASNASGTGSKTVDITVYPVPAADFSVDKTTGCYPTTINFTNTSTGGGAGATVTSWIWDFGDGFLDNTNFSTSHTYHIGGSIPVTLAVQNNYGCNGKAQVKTINGAINLSPGIFPDFTPVLNSTCTLPVSASFTNQTTGPGTITYSWDFGDSPPWTDNTPSPNHNYTAPGTYNVRLAASSSLGCADTLVTPVTISSNGNVSDFSGAGNVCVNTLANFFNTSTPTPISANWDYGDGTNSNSINGQHTYSTPGPYTVTVTNNFSGCTGTASKTVTVVNPPATAFTGTNLNSCNAPLNVQFTDQTPGATSWLWNFGDGTTSTIQNPSHPYNSLGSYQVSLTASSAAGCSSNLTKPGYVNIAKPVVSISNAPAYGCAPLTYTATASVQSADGVATYAWDLGNGNSFNGPNPPAQVYAAGTYTVKLTITTTGGCQSTATGTVKVGTTQPTTAFSATPLTQCVGQNIQFTDGSVNANQWFWDFGDGSTDTTRNPLYSYTKPGTYDITLTAYNNGCFQKLTKPAYITINPPLADFSYSFACGNKTNYTFTDKSIGAVTYDWDFGDGSPHSFIANPTHNYSAAVTTPFNVTLKVTNGGCSNTKTQQIIVNQSIAVTLAPNPVCNNSLVNISATGPGNIVNYVFDFGDGTTVAGGNGATSHTYTAPNDYNVVVTTIDANGCMESSAPAIMHVSGPTIKFTTPTQVSCGPLTAVFTDQSTAAPGTTLTTWTWDFGDGTTASGKGPVSHNYAFQGVFSIKLKISDSNGCTDSLTAPNYITVSNPAAKYITDDSNYCPSSNIKFNNVSTGGFNPVYVWDFDDATTYTGPNPPLHMFSAVKKYNVKLTLTDAYNCVSTYISPTPINIDVPVATFTMSSNYSACPPLTDTFKFTGSYAKSYTWNFDNGKSAIIASPSSIYTQPGDYDPRLTITSPGGCIATSTQHIHIDGPIGAFSYSPLTGCDALNVNFQVTTANVIKFIWNFNDNTIDSTLAPVNTISHLYTVPNAYAPFVTLVDAAGCRVPIFGTSQIEVDHINKTDFKVDNPIVCDKGTVNFVNSSLVANGTSITDYTWDFGDGSPLQSGLTDSLSHFYAAPGVYNATLSITTLGNCTGTTSMPITVAASPQVVINGLISQCEPAILNFSGAETVPDPNGPLTWSWNFGNGQTATGQNPAPVSYPKAGEYVVQLIATNTKGCSDATDTTTPSHLFIYPIPAVNAGADTTICLGSPLQLNATGAATSYNWLAPINGAALSCLPCTNPIADPVPTSTYFVVNGTSINGCQAKDTIQVTVNTPVTVSISGPDSVCLGQSVQLTATGAAIYSWTPAEGLNNPNIGNPLAKPDAAQAGSAPSTVLTYQVTGYDSKKCFSDTKTVNVTVFNYPVITLAPNVTINVGSTYQMNPTVSSNVVSYSWTPPGTLSCVNCLTPVAKPTITTKYSLTVVNDGGCASSDSIRIQVICNGANFFVPNSFSPNGDGVNDHFIINGVGLNVIPSIIIYNRWGQIVFQRSNFAANSAAEAWDGLFNGQPAPADVYVYTIQILCDNATLIPYHGNVTLIR
jgi:gliding motility-associated-like protein